MATSIWSWNANSVSHSLSLIERVRQDISRFQDGRHIPPDTLEYILLCIELASRELIVLGLNDQLSESQKEALRTLQQCLSITQELETLNRLTESSPVSSRNLSVDCSGVGRPSYQIPEDTLEILLENRFTVPQISKMFGVSVSTIRRRMSLHGLFVRRYYSSVSDSDLDALVKDIQHQYPMCGNRQMQGHLISKGYRVQQSRLRVTQRRIDPAGTALRRLRVLNRRHYSVPAPLSLYHIDGNHKLIRYLYM